MVFDFVFGNALRFDLPSDFFDNETTLDVPSSVASDVSSALANGGRMPFVLADTATITPNTTIEIVYATSADTGNNTLTVTRGQEGTTPATWPSGTVAQNAVTSGALNVAKESLLGQNDFQIRLLEANRLLDATVAGDEVEVIAPINTRIWSWRIIYLPINLDPDPNSAFASFEYSVGTASGGNDVASNYQFDAENIGQRAWNYTGNNKIGTNDRFYIHIIGADTDSAANEGRVLLECMVGPQSESGV